MAGKFCCKVIGNLLKHLRLTAIDRLYSSWHQVGTADPLRWFLALRYCTFAGFIRPYTEFTPIFLGYKLGVVVSSPAVIATSVGSKVTDT